MPRMRELGGSLVDSEKAPRWATENATSTVMVSRMLLVQAQKK